MRYSTEFRDVRLDELIIPDESMREVLSSGRTSETTGAIHVFPRDDMPGYEISDGCHRVADAMRRGETTIRAEIEPVPDDEQYDPPFYDFRPHVLPVPGDAITCGLRLELPRKQRRHIWAELGEDFKNGGEKGIVQVPVRACTRCGKDDR